MTIAKKALILCLFAITLSMAQKDGALTDLRDGKEYKIVKIGEQTWMAENLNYNASGSKCYDNQASNCNTYGRLYNWATANKACPLGWHLPSMSEWEILTKTVGGEQTEGKKLKAKSGWSDNEGKSGNGTDEFGFSALPGGSGRSDGSFSNVGYGYWWSSNESSASNVYIRGMGYDYEIARWLNIDKSNLFSVRCVKD